MSTQELTSWVKIFQYFPTFYSAALIVVTKIRWRLQYVRACFHSSARCDTDDDDDDDDDNAQDIYVLAAYMSVTLIF